MRHLWQKSMWLVLVCGGLGLSSAHATTQGYQECVEDCYRKECGEVGVRCPTVTQKQMYRRKCAGHCREKMRRQGEERRIAAHQRKMAEFRAKAKEAKRLLVLRHRLWLEKQKVLHQMRMQLRKAEQGGPAQTDEVVQIRGRMYAAEEQMHRAAESKLVQKERFYRTRRRIRRSQRTEFRRRIRRLRKRVQDPKAPPKARERAQKEIVARETKIKDLRKKEAVLNVNYYDARVKRNEQTSKRLNATRRNISHQQKIAKKQKDEKKLEELAKRLGSLAGQQAALSQKSQLDKTKLKRAKTVLTSAGDSPASKVH